MAKAKKQMRSARKTTGRRDDSLATVASDAVADVTALIASLKGAGLGNLTAEERAHSNGKLREGEDAAMNAILGVVDAFPNRFAAIAAQDHGTDDAVVETQPARAAIARRETLAPLAEALAEAALLVGDEMLASGALAKDVTGPAYAIIKANAAVDPKLRKAAASAVTFYGKAAQKALRTLAKKKGSSSGGPTPAT